MPLLFDPRIFFCSNSICFINYAQKFNTCLATMKVKWIMVTVKPVKYVVVLWSVYFVFRAPHKWFFPVHSLVCRRPANTLSFTNTTIIHKQFYQQRTSVLFIGYLTFLLKNCHCPITTNIVLLEADMHNIVSHPDAILWYWWCLST